MTPEEWKSLSSEEKAARVDELPEFVPHPGWERRPRRPGHARFGVKDATVLIVGLSLISLVCFGLYRWSASRPVPGYSRSGPPAGSSSQNGRAGYGAGYALGRDMGLRGHGLPTDSALRALSEMHAPNDALQFRLGYRNGWDAGREESSRRR